MTEARTIKAARALHAMFQNPQVAAYSRAVRAKTQRSRVFWFGVGNFLFKPHAGMCWTDDDMHRWNLIRGAAQ